MNAPESDSAETRVPIEDPTLYPDTFEDFVGQERVKGRLQLAIEAAKQTGAALGHILLVGPPDFGKATLAKIIPKLIGVRAMMLSGTTSDNLNDFSGFLTSLEEQEVMLIDGIHAIDRNVAEFLCEPMKDFKIDIKVDRGPNVRAVRINLPRFTLIGTATQTQRMSPAFLSSFQIVEEMDAYTRGELAELVHRFGQNMGIEVEEGVCQMIAGASSGSPRDVLYRLKHVRDYGRIKAPSQRLTTDLAEKALKMLTPTLSAGKSRKLARLGAKRELSLDPLKRRYQVFVSSTYEDLKEERRHVLQALLETKCIPTGMELFPATSEEKWKLIRRVIDDCDYYIVVIAGRYGSQGREGKSYTEMEFDYALSSGKSVIGFYHANPESLPGTRLERNEEQQKKLALFTDKVKRRMCKSWNSPEGLASAIKSAILHAIENDRKPGWIRASDLPSPDAIAVLKESVRTTRRGNSGESLDNVEATIELPFIARYLEMESRGKLAPPLEFRRQYSHFLVMGQNELFLILGPRLEVARPRRTLKLFLEEQLTEGAKLVIPITPGTHFRRVHLDLEMSGLEQVLDTFVSEKLVKIVRPPKGLSTKVPYWVITPKGQQRLAALRVAARKMV